MKRPQITLLVLFFLEIVTSWFKHWQDRLDKKWNPIKYNIWITILSVWIVLFLLYSWWFFTN